MMTMTTLTAPPSLRDLQAMRDRALTDIARVEAQLANADDAAVAAVLAGDDPPDLAGLREQLEAARRRLAALDRAASRQQVDERAGMRASEIGFVESLAPDYRAALGRLRHALETAAVEQANVHKMWSEIDDSLHRARTWCDDPVAAFRPPVTNAEQSLGGCWQGLIGAGDGINQSRLSTWLADCDAAGIVAVPPTSKKGR